MKILYDYQAFSNQRAGGVSRYFVELFRQFEAMGFEDWETIAGLYLNLHLKAARDQLAHVRGVCLPAFVPVNPATSFVNRAVFSAAHITPCETTGLL